MSSPIANTPSGRLRGATVDGIHVFKGIPYGGSTSGTRRFLPPIPVEPWTGIRNATQFGPICPQTGALVDKAQSDARVVGALISLPQNEDCLVLNVWTPGLADGGNRPVMLWLHGRGYGEGAGSETWYDGARLSRRGNVVVITINHRLHVFGYLHLATLVGEKFAGSGIAGMMDVVQALRWVRDNATSFGGDPQNVTVFGESGGGAKVSSLMAMPAAKGLFHKAVIQSGPAIRGLEDADATDLAVRLMERLGVDRSDPQQLQRLPPERLVDAMAAGAVSRSARAAGLSHRGGGALRFAPVVHGAHYPRHPFHPDAAPTSIGVPLLIGTNLDESAMFLAADKRRRRLTIDELRQRVSPQLGDRMDVVLGAYRRTRPTATPWDLLIAVSSEPTHIASILLAERKLASDPHTPLFVYLFTWQSDFMGGLFKAAHALEIPFVFDNCDRVPVTGDRPDKHTLAAQMSEAWIAFARTGNPSHATIPTWPAYTRSARDTMIFDVPCRTERDPRRDEIDAWKGISLRR